MTTETLTYFFNNFFVYFFLFNRFLLLFFLFPLFSSTYFPNKIKIVLSLLLSFALTPAINVKLPYTLNLFSLIIFIFLDFIIFFFISLFFRFILTALQIGGEMIGLQMGLGITQTIDPIGGVSIPIISEFLFILFLLVFFTLDLHHYLIIFVYRSFDIFPLGFFVLKENFLLYFLKKSKIMFDLSVRILGPIMIIMYLIHIILAIIGRIIPQINILFVSFPLTLGIGLLLFGFTLFLLPKVFSGQLLLFKDFLNTLIKTVR